MSPRYFGISTNASSPFAYSKATVIKNIFFPSITGNSRKTFIHIEVPFLALLSGHHSTKGTMAWCVVVEVQSSFGRPFIGGCKVQGVYCYDLKSAA